MPETTLYDSVALVQPACRMVVVVVSIQDEGSVSDALPVLALQSVIEDRQPVTTRPLVMWADLGITDGTTLECLNVAAEVVVCPWPAEDDEDRLSDIIDRVEKRARLHPGDRR